MTPADDATLVEARDTAQSMVEAWAEVCEGLEAHLMDRVAMQDEASPASYLSILRSSMAHVQRGSEQIRAARWADFRRQQDQIARLEAEIAAIRQADGWRDIAEAPREHLARFLVYATPRSDSEQVIYEVTRYDDQWGNQIRLNDGYGSYQERDILARATHFRPLPAPPQQMGEG